MNVIKPPFIIYVITAALLMVGLSVWSIKVIKEKSVNNEVRQKLEKISCNDCNVVLISVDTLRADHVSGLGYKKKTTPNIDSFFDKAIVFKNNISASSWTLPSHMTFMTGLLPSHHGVVNKFILNYDRKTEEIATLSKVSPGTKTLAEYLKENGYATGGFTGGAGVDKQFGFDRGFDQYYDENNFGGFEDSISKAMDWIKNNKNKKMFVFLHGYDLHGQFVPKDGYDKRFVDFEYKGNLTGSLDEQKKLREDGITNGQVYLTPEDVKYLTALYDEKIQRADERLKNFFEEYSALGLNNKTVFILTSDHGEEFYEHGQIDHGHSLYEELIRVPLLIKYPDVKEKTEVNIQTSGADIAPTILSITGTKTEGNFDGTDLSRINDSFYKRSVISETEYRYVVDQKSIRKNDGWKFIMDVSSNLDELYNLKNDPDEKNNLINKSNKKRDLLFEELNEKIEE